MTGYSFALADAADDDAINRLLAQSDLPGWISLSFRAGNGGHAMPHPRAVSQTLVARGDDGLAGMVTRSVFPGVFDGRDQPLSYLGHFRVAPFARRRVKLLARAFAALRDSFSADPPWSFASLLDDNRAAQRLLTSGLPGFPRFTPVGRLQTLALRSHRSATDLPVRQASAEDLPRIAAFHRAHAGPLSPVLSPDDLAQGRWPGLAPQDFLLAEQGGKLLGLCALWDQRAFRQLRVTGYRAPLSRFRGLLNLLGPLTGLPHLPPPGQDLALGHLSFLAVPPGDPATALLLIRAARGLAFARGLRSIALGLATDDPLFQPLRDRLRCTRYGSCIYAVTWQDGVAPPPRAFIAMRPEIGLL